MISKSLSRADTTSPKITLVYFFVKLPPHFYYIVISGFIDINETSY